LFKALNSLTESLVEQAIKAEEQISVASGLANESNSFETAFAAKPPTESGSGLERRSIFFREAAASLKIIGILSKETSGNNSEPSGPVTLSAEVANQVRKRQKLWIVYAIRMNLMQCLYLEHRYGDLLQMILSRSAGRPSWTTKRDETLLSVTRSVHIQPPR
jgi:hypothetical protein